jgi:hypothetical protein
VGTGGAGMKKRSDAVVIVAFCALAAGFFGWIHGFSRPAGNSGSGTSVTGDSAPGGSGGGATEYGRLVIPSIGTNAPVSAEGAAGPDGGALDIPSDVRDVGWWDGVWQSPNGQVDEKVASPGQPGVALIAGHIDSAAQGEGALYRLQQLKAGSSVTVYGQNGAKTSWTVQRVQVVNKSALPDSLYVNSGPAQLAIVSCGGPFDAATGHYVDNVIAWATPAAS